MDSLDAACGDNPEELLRSQGFRLSVDSESQMAVFFGDTEGKDLLQIEETAGDILRLFIVNRYDVAPVVLRFFDFSVRIVKDYLSGRSADPSPVHDITEDIEGASKNVLPIASWNKFIVELLDQSISLRYNEFVRKSE
jgi:hypothetical protein